MSKFCYSAICCTEIFYYMYCSSVGYMKLVNEIVLKNSVSLYSW